MISAVNYCWDQLVLRWGTNLEACVLLFWLPETSMDMDIQWSTTAPHTGSGDVIFAYSFLSADQVLGYILLFLLHTYTLPLFKQIA